MDKEVVERVARALFAADWPNDKWDRFKPTDAAPNRYRMLARAAIAAHRSEAEIEYEIWQDDQSVAGSTDPDDAAHYLQVYVQDGPVELVEVLRFRSAHRLGLSASPLSQGGQADG